MIQKHFIETLKTARYFQLGNPDTCEQILFVLHGYGQSAAYFIKNFEGLSEKYLIIAPEAMHQFYLSGSSGRVGASWMTKEEREVAITDNLVYLENLRNHLVYELGNKPMIVLGFSQGGATAARWCAKLPDTVPMILWASVFPPDLAINTFPSATKHYFVLGKDDPYFKGEAYREALDFYRTHGFQVNEFDGEHRIEIESLKKILEQIR